MVRKTTALLLVVAACTGATAETTIRTTTTTTVPETTTTAPETTTTTPPVVAITGGERQLNNLVRAYYAYGRGLREKPPAGVPRGLLPKPGVLETRKTVEIRANIAEYRGTRVAVLVAGDDVLGAIEANGAWKLSAGWVPSMKVRPWFGDEAMLVAVIGSDARRGDNRDTALGDSLHIVGMDGTRAAGIVGIPRDSWLSIPGVGTSKVNAALAAGGPEKMTETLEEFSDLDLDGYVLTGFSGFVAMVDDVLGPFELDVPAAFSDRSAKADFDEGVQEVDGRAALAFARTRKAFIEGDFRRSFNQGLVMIAGTIAAKLRGHLAVPDLIAGTEEHMSTSLSPEQLLRMSLAVQRLNPLKMENVVLKGSTGTTSGGASIVVLDQDAAAEVFADLADGNLGS
jgi:LCP family protein required for cell wall assembly